MDRATEVIEALYTTARWLLDRDRQRDAIVVFRSLLVAAPADERGWLGLGACHEALGQLDVALSLYELAADATHAPRCHFARARLLRSIDRDDDAEGAFEAAIDALTQAPDDDLLALALRERRAP